MGTPEGNFMIRRSFLEPSYAGFMLSRIPLMFLALSLTLAAQGSSGVTSTANDRTALGLTIYHNNLAMVRETRNIQIPIGVVHIAFADVAASIKPKSSWMEFRNSYPGPYVTERNFEFNLLSPIAALDASIGLPATFRSPTDDKLKWGELVSIPLRKKIWAPGRTPLQRIARIGRVLREPDLGALIHTTEGYEPFPEDRVILREAPLGLRSTPTLLASVESSQPANCPVDITYMAEGFTWQTNYVASLSKSGNFIDLDAWVTLSNSSGTNFRDASLQLLAGEPNQVWERPLIPTDDPILDKTETKTAIQSPPRFKEEQISEFHLFTLDRPTTLLNNQTKQVKLFKAERVPIKRTYFFDWNINDGWFSSAIARKVTPGPWIRGFEDLSAWLMRTYDIDP
ncbi:MAG: hypothetical protein WAT51_01170, partial [Holophaga sp.]